VQAQVMGTELLAKLSRLIFQADLGGFAIAEFIDTSTARRFKAKGAFSFSPKADAKQTYRLIGEWEAKSKYGETFKTIYSEALRPQELKGIAPYLAHNIKGIGEVTAKKLIDHLQVKTIDDLVETCRNNSDKIFAFFSEKKKRLAQNVIDMMVLNEVFRSIMIFLHENEISPKFAKKIYEKYGAKSIDILMENPYRLISDFRQIGFLKADAIAQKLGLEKNSLFRVEAALIYSLEQATDDGHCSLPKELLIENVGSHLGARDDPQFSHQFVLDSMRKVYKKNKDDHKESFTLRTLKTQNIRYNRENILFSLPELQTMEDEVSIFLKTLLKPESNYLASPREKEICENFSKSKKTFEEYFQDIPWQYLSDEQKQAVKLSFESSIMILTGGPGCGKTFVLKSIFKLQKMLSRKIALCAPTGLAAKRMTQSIGTTAFTIHKLLGLGAKREQLEKSSIENPENISVDEKMISKVDVIVVDESSMLNLEIFYTLLKAGGPNKKFIFVGDVDQLPSVGAGNCLKDMMSSKQIPTITLTKIFRQSSESPIPLAAREIILGHMPALQNFSHPNLITQKEDLAFIPCVPDTFFEYLTHFVTKIVPDIYNLDPAKDCQIIVPMRRTAAGQENINRILQDTLNPEKPGKMECRHPSGFIIRVHDKLIQTKNNYELDVFNGDLGYCQSIRKTSDGLEMDVEFSHKVVTYSDDQIEHLQLCYAMTIHKSQGSEFPLCIIPLFGLYYTMLDRNLLYTAITRSSKHVILFGEQWAFKKAIRNQNANKRFTALEYLLVQQ